VVVHKDALWCIGSDEEDPDEKRLFRDLFKDETQRDVVIESLKADCEVRTGTGLRVFEVVSRR
jgi:hypothetical protein